MTISLEGLGREDALSVLDDHQRRIENLESSSIDSGIPTWHLITGDEDDIGQGFEYGNYMAYGGFGGFYKSNGEVRLTVAAMNVDSGGPFPQLFCRMPVGFRADEAYRVFGSGPDPVSGAPRVASSFDGHGNLRYYAPGYKYASGTHENGSNYVHRPVAVDAYAIIELWVETSASDKLRVYPNPDGLTVGAYPLYRIDAAEGDVMVVDLMGSEIADATGYVLDIMYRADPVSMPNV